MFRPEIMRLMETSDCLSRDRGSSDEIQEPVAPATEDSLEASFFTCTFIYLAFLLHWPVIGLSIHFHSPFFLKSLASADVQLKT